MGVVSPSQSNAGDTIEASDINGPVNQLAAVINGNIDANNLADSAVTTSKIAANSVTTAKIDTTAFSGYVFDFVESGCVWTGDSYGSTRAASMTAGVVWIGGKRVSVAAVTARTFTASSDVYVDVDNTGTITYTDKSNNAASQALAANSIRLAIIVVGASSIAAAASINQGQEDRVLPIASSTPYAFTDSLGNVICPRDPTRRSIGYRQVVTNQVGITVATDITGLTMTVIVPSGRKVKFSPSIFYSHNGANSQSTISLLEGATVLAIWYTANGNTSNALTFPTPPKTITPTAGTHTYKLVANPTGGGTFNISTDSANGVTPSLLLELE